MITRTSGAAARVWTVQRRPGHLFKAILRVGAATYACAIGRSGLKACKREGDGGTPRGAWRLREIWYRPDRISRPRTRLPILAIRRHDGWCDAAGDRNYNRRVELPYPASAESLWRDDDLYDLVAVLDYNLSRRSRERGSCIFMHHARPDYAPTEGCVALRAADLARLVAIAAPGTVLAIS